MFAPRNITFLLSLGFLLGCNPTASVGAGSHAALNTPGADHLENGAPRSFADIVEVVRPGIVNVYSMRNGAAGDEEGAAETAPRRSLGSGFVFDEAGLILTSAHVIEDADSIHIAFDDGREFDGSVVGLDAATDVAVIRIQAAGLSAIPLGDSDQARVGDWMLVLGNPFGLSSSLTVGVLSGRGRRDVSMRSNIRYTNFLQTDASINPGNSGGPLIDLNGQVVGITIAVNRSGQGIAFAIPINMVREILPDLLEHGEVPRGWLGVYVDDLGSQALAALGLPQGGVQVREPVRGGPAARGGVLPGDIIIGFDGTPVAHSEDLKWVSSRATAGESVSLDIVREGERLSLEVFMGRLSQ